MVSRARSFQILIVHLIKETSAVKVDFFVSALLRLSKDKNDKKINHLFNFEESCQLQTEYSDSPSCQLRTEESDSSYQLQTE